MKIFNLQNIRKYTQTIVSILKIFFLSFKIFYKNKNSKFIFFYFPVKAYQENIVDVINLLNKKSDIYAYTIYNSSSTLELKKNKNSFFIDFDYLRFVPFANFFLSKINLLISSYVIYVFLPNTKNIYISHDIYDTPMVNKNIEKNLFLALSKLDYIFVSSDFLKKYYESSFKKYQKNNINNINNKKVNVVNTGYLKLDHVVKLLKKTKYQKNKFCILIAPTACKHYSKYNLSSDLRKIINSLVVKKYHIIYRPHPLDLTYKGNQFLVEKIKQNYQKFKNFELDFSPSYIESYKKSDLLLTDFSGTAYTYAFSKKSPVIFYSKYPNIKLPNDLKKLYYFKDRKNVGYVVSNFLDMQEKVKKINKNKNIFTYKIQDLLSKRIQYNGNSLNKTQESIIKLFK